MSQLLEGPGGSVRDCSHYPDGSCSPEQSSKHTYLILLGQSPILGVANADDNVRRAEAKVRVVSDVIDAHILLFSNELRQSRAE